MSLVRTPATENLCEVLERVLDRGVTLDPWHRASEGGLSLDGRIVRIEADPSPSSCSKGSRRARAERVR